MPFPDNIRQDYSVGLLEFLDAGTQKPGNQRATSRHWGTSNVDWSRPTAFMGCITDFVFKVKWGQTERQAMGGLVITLLSWRVLRRNRIWRKFPSHQAFYNTEMHLEVTERWQSFLGVRQSLLEWTCQVPFLPSLPHPIIKDDTWLQTVITIKRNSPGFWSSWKSAGFTDQLPTPLLSWFFAVKSFWNRMKRSWAATDRFIISQLVFKGGEDHLHCVGPAPGMYSLIPDSC